MEATAILIGVIFSRANEAELVEIMWTVMAVFGAGFSLWNMHEAYLDYKALDSSMSNGRRSLAKAAIELEFTRLLILAILLLVGLFALTEPGYAFSGMNPKSYALVLAIQWTLLLCASFVLFQSFSHFLLRRKLMK